MMNPQRVVRLSEVRQAHWLIGCPVEIVKGALLYDNLNANVILQLKLRNVSAQTIKQVDIAVRRLDLASDPIPGLEDPVTMTYSDIQVQARKTFGEKSPIVLGSNATRNVQIIFTKAVFVDGQVWRNKKHKPELAFPAQDLAAVLDPELAGQFDREYTAEYPPCQDPDAVSDHHLMPQQLGCAWVCTCGFPNSPDWDSCGRCGVSKAWLFQSCDRNHLEQKLLAYREDKRASFEKQQILDQEAALRQAAQRAAQAKTRKHQFKTAALVILIDIAILAAVFLATRVIVPQAKYKAATDLMKQKDYAAAQTAFSELAANTYKDSESKADLMRQYIKFNKAQALLSSERFAEAVALLQTLDQNPDFRASLEQARAGLYLAAKNLEDRGDYWAAIEQYGQLDDFRDSLDRIEACMANVYAQAITLLNSQSYLSAASLFAQLGDYAEARPYAQYASALDLYSQNPESIEAFQVFWNLGAFLDASQYAETINWQNNFTGIWVSTDVDLENYYLIYVIKDGAATHYYSDEAFPSDQLTTAQAYINDALAVPSYDCIIEVAADGTIVWQYQVDGTQACTAEISADGITMTLHGLTQSVEETITFTYIGEASSLAQLD